MSDFRLLSILSIIAVSVLLNFAYAFQGQTHQPIVDVSFGDEFNSFNKNDLVNIAGLRGVYLSSQNEDYAKKLENYFIERGFLYANISRVTSSYDSSKMGVNLVFTGSLGQIVLLGDVEIKSTSIAAEKYQNILSVKKYDVYSEKTIESDINAMLSLAADSGYIFAEAHIENIGMKNVETDLLANIVIDIKEGDAVRIEGIEIIGNSYTREYVIQRELPVRIGDIYLKSEIDKIPQDLLNLGLFKNVTPSNLLLSKNGNYILSLVVEEGNSTTFDGVVGYIPDKSVKSGGYFTGLLDVQFRNLFGTARKFKVHWEKPDQFSENFLFRFTEPWVFNIPLDLSAGLERTLRDSTYIEWKGDIHAKWRITKNLSLVSSFAKQVVLPDSTSNQNLRLARYEQYNLEAGFLFDTRDYPVNPRSGFLIENSYILGLKNNFGPGYLLQEDSIKTSEQIELFKIGLEWYYEILRNQVIAIRLYGNQVTGDRLQLTDYFWFGGARTLRGYRENQFSGDLVSWLKLEYRFLSSRDTRIFVFNDWGAYHFKSKELESDDVLTGYGVGLRLDTALGIMAIDFGLGKDDDFSDAKIHFGIINRF